jgi:hypothetical protein
MKTIDQYINARRYQDCEYWLEDEPEASTQMDPHYLGITQTDEKLGNIALNYVIRRGQTFRVNNGTEQKQKH